MEEEGVSYKVFHEGHVFSFKGRDFKTQVKQLEQKYSRNGARQNGLHRRPRS